MIHEMFTIYDSKVESFSPPFSAQTRGSAIRSFTDTCNDPGTIINSHPEDFTLFVVGTFDDATAMFELVSTPVSLGVAINFKKEI